MAEQSYHKQHAANERQLAQTVAREAVEILYGPAERPNRQGVGHDVAVAYAVIVEDGKLWALIHKQYFGGSFGGIIRSR